eukprot:349655-Chlamydomonas_euryale.AAC.1
MTPLGPLQMPERPFSSARALVIHMKRAADSGRHRCIGAAMAWCPLLSAKAAGYSCRYGLGFGNDWTVQLGPAIAPQRICRCITARPSRQMRPGNCRHCLGLRCPYRPCAASACA